VGFYTLSLVVPFVSWFHNVHGLAQLAQDLIERRPITATTEDLTTLATRVKTLRGLYAQEYALQKEFIADGIRDLAGVDLEHAQERNRTWQKEMGAVLLRIDEELRRRVS